MRLFTLAALAAVIATTAAAETRVTERDLSGRLVRCDRPVASISVGAFSCKARACQDVPAWLGGRSAGTNLRAQSALIRVSRAPMLAMTSSNAGAGPKIIALIAA